MNAIYPYKIASKLFSVCALLDKYFICQIINLQVKTKILSQQKLFIKIQGQLGSFFCTPFFSLTISIHMRILEALLENFLSNSYMLQTPRLFQGFSYNLHCLARHYNYSLHAFKFSYVARSKQTSFHPPKEKTSPLMSGFLR